MKRGWIFAVLMSLVLVFGMVGCDILGNKDDDEDDDDSNSQTSSRYSAEIYVENINTSASVDVRVDGSKKTISSGSTASWTVYWSGTTTYKVIIATSTDSKTAYVKHGDRKTYTVGTNKTSSIMNLNLNKYKE